MPHNAENGDFRVVWHGSVEGRNRAIFKNGGFLRFCRIGCCHVNAFYRYKELVWRAVLPHNAKIVKKSVVWQEFCTHNRFIALQQGYVAEGRLKSMQSGIEEHKRVQRITQKAPKVHAQQSAQCNLYPLYQEQTSSEPQTPATAAYTRQGGAHPPQHPSPKWTKPRERPQTNA